MQFKKGADVVTADGEKVGDIDRVVIDPREQEVTHVVVREGFLFSEDKVVPVELVASATEDRVTLQDAVEDLDALPSFEEHHYIPLTGDERARSSVPEEEDYVPPLYWYPAYGAPMTYPTGHPTPTYATEVERNIPEDTVPLEEGAEVISVEGEHVGDVERVITDSRDKHVSHFLIAEGVLFKEKKLVPISWIDVVGENEVHLAVGSAFLENLPEYREE